MKKAEKVAKARIQNAVAGFSIPLMSISALYKALQQGVDAGQSDDELRATVRAFPSVVEVLR